jgi:hypothetical protein
MYGFDGMTSHSRISFANLPRLEEKIEKPEDPGYARLFVPPATYVVAKGPHEDIGYLYTMTASSIALALIAQRKKSPFAFVVFGNLDEGALHVEYNGGRSRTRMLMDECWGRKIQQAYIVSSGSNPYLLGQVVSDLTARKVPIQILKSNHIAQLGLDLVDGRPVRPDLLDDHAAYGLSREASIKICHKVHAPDRRPVHSLGNLWEMPKDDSFVRNGPEAQNLPIGKPVLEAWSARGGKAGGACGGGKQRKHQGRAIRSLVDIRWENQ